ncbi:MAG TPA: SpoIID/LytB domain-containing protein [Desulfuromonadaceae bacterium]
MNIFVPLVLVIIIVFSGYRTRKVVAAPSQETIRVAIVKNAAAVTIDGDGILATRENGSAVVFSLPVSIKSTTDGIAVDGVNYRRLTFSAPSAVYINSKPYRGLAEVSFGDKGLLVVNELPLEDYLVGLINCEISSAWPIEAIKAQAVIARSYALNRKQLRHDAVYHLESSVIDQVYDGCLIEDSRARRGVTETAGEVLVFNGAIIQAFYHSNCGGKTEAAENIWGASLPYLKGVDCQYCLTSASSSWEQKLTLKQIEEKLRASGFSVAGISEIKAGVRNNRGRLKNVVIGSMRGELVVTGEQFRKALGYSVIKSTNFNIKIINKEAVFNGLGNGHGVGLCQWGCKQRAQDGFSYDEILSYYYPGTTINQFSEIR